MPYVYNLGVQDDRNPKALRDNRGPSSPQIQCLTTLRGQEKEVIATLNTAQLNLNNSSISTTYFTTNLRLRYNTTHPHSPHENLMILASAMFIKLLHTPPKQTLKFLTQLYIRLKGIPGPRIQRE